jgi:hypothetical protein
VSRRRRRRHTDGPFDEDEVLAIGLFAGADRLRNLDGGDIPNFADRWRRHGAAVLAEHEVSYVPVLLAAYGVPDNWTPTDPQTERQQ